jgi:hypothetical protein
MVASRSDRIGCRMGYSNVRAATRKWPHEHANETLDVRAISRDTCAIGVLADIALGLVMLRHSLLMDHGIMPASRLTVVPVVAPARSDAMKGAI